MDTLILTIQLLTRIPINKQIDVKDEMLSKGVMYWPVVGLIIGVGQAIVYMLLSLILPKPVAVIFAVLSEICINGGFHLDGLCDTADAIYSARTKERMLEIMKDSRVGTNGVIAAFFDLMLKIFLLMSSVDTEVVLILAPVAGKMVQGILMYKARYARKKGLGHSYIGRISLKTCLICSISGAVFIGACLAFFGKWFLFPVPLLCMLAAFGFRKYIESKIDGMTGDTLGAGSEVTEILFLLLVAIAQSMLWW